MLVGGAFGGFVIVVDPAAKEVLLPFSHLLGDPSERVAKEEAADDDRLQRTFNAAGVIEEDKVQAERRRREPRCKGRLHDCARQVAAGNQTVSSPCRNA